MSYEENKSIFKELKRNGKLEKGHWYLIKDKDNIVKSKDKEELIEIMRKIYMHIIISYNMPDVKHNILYPPYVKVTN